MDWWVILLTIAFVIDACVALHLNSLKFKDVKKAEFITVYFTLEQQIKQLKNDYGACGKNIEILDVSQSSFSSQTYIVTYKVSNKSS